MTHRTYLLPLVLALLLLLSLTACGDSSDDVTGDDWRVSGVVAAEGTITHEGEGSVKVLVTVGPESAAFYRDEPEQELLDSVSFPVTVEDANDDGLAYHDEDGLVYPAGWIPEAPYDPADDWGENWMDNWDI